MRLHLRSTTTGAHAKGVTSLASSGSLVASAGYDGAVRLWDSQHGRLDLLHEEALDCGPIFSVALTEVEGGDTMLAVGCYQRRVHVWRSQVPDFGSADQFALRLQWRSMQHTGWVRALAVATHGCVQKRTNAMYSIGCNRILGWAVPDQPQCDPRTADSELAIFEDAAEVRSHDVLCLSHSNEMKALAAGNVDGALRAWSTSEFCDGPCGLPRQACAHWRAHDDRVTAVAWTHEGCLLSAAYDGWVRSWRRPESRDRTRAWQLQAEASIATDGRVLSLACGGTGSRATALCGTSAGEIVLLQGADLVPVERLGLSTSARSPRVSAMATYPASGVEGFVVGDSEGDLHVVDVQSTRASHT